MIRNPSYNIYIWMYIYIFISFKLWGDEYGRSMIKGIIEPFRLSRIWSRPDQNCHLIILKEGFLIHCLCNYPNTCIVLIWHGVTLKWCRYLFPLLQVSGGSYIIDMFTMEFIKNKIAFGIWNLDRHDLRSKYFLI